MNSTAQQAWSRPTEQLDQMAQINDDLDDLGNLFEFGDIDLNPIAPVDSSHYGDHIQHTGTHPNTPFDELNEAQSISGSAAQDFGSHGQFGMSQNGDRQQQHQFNGQAQTTHPYPQDPMYQPSMHSQQHHPFYANQQFPFQGMQGFPPSQVPPTPNSFEMHGEQGRFMQQQMDPQQRAILEQRYLMSKENGGITLTPMASPISGPFNVHNAAELQFSPLASPMLDPQHAQNGIHQHQGFYTNPSTAPSSNATSPLDPNADVDMGDDSISLSEPAVKQARKSNRKKPATPRSAGPLGRVKQSPIQKAIKRKSGTMLSSLAPPRESNAEPPRSSSTQPMSGGLQMPRNDSSENGSISPEPLSESLMGPPPRPGSSLHQSPALPGQQKDASGGSVGSAATPKSLLSVRGSQRTPAHQTEQSQTNGAHHDQMDFEELELPASATEDSTSRPSLPQIDTQIQQPNSTDDTPRISARKTPKLGPSSTPSSARPTSSMASPSIVGSPMTASTPGALLKDRKQDSKGARSNKKRGSVSGSGSALVSPALRPRISPSIKPLLPDGASMHSPTHALLLASKSNYQNLLEGNHLPGVNYPDSLSTGLTSKRTSHKVAEQGRRNRINEALKEMQALLPKSSSSKTGKDASNSDGSPEAGADCDSKESKEDASVKSNSSKAATVESANEYIRRLQRENAALLMLKKDHDEMKKKLDEQTASERSSSNVGSTSPAPEATNGEEE